MPENAPITFISTTLPEGACYANDQQRFNAFAAALQGFLPGSYKAYVVQSTTPEPEDRDKAWLKLDGDGFPVGWYYYADGQWVWPNPVPASGYERRIWVGNATTDLETYDGGSAGAVSATTGPMWEVDTVFAAKFPVGVGTFAAAGTISVGGSTTNTGTTGEDKHDLTLNEIPPHTHNVVIPLDTLNNTGQSGFTNEFSSDGSSSSTVISNSAGGGAPHNNLPPMLGVYFIKRTARSFYTA